jgi:predicted DNA-binding transcriptional regulator AlpA
VGGVARLLGVSRQRADQLSRQVGFPTPVTNGGSERQWRREHILDWARREGRDVHV